MRNDLTPSELRTLKMIARGWQGKEAAKQLGISPCTVKDQMQRIYIRLGATTAAHAVGLAIIGGIIKPEDLK
jgi:DNA-binding NarL/FixJ family response regulator